MPTVSWAPRFAEASSWTSSITTCATSSRATRIFEPVRIAWRLSGVVMSTSGGSSACFDRSYCVVSP